MKRIKVTLLALLLLIGVLCTGTVVASAETRNSYVNGHSVMAETSLSRTNGSALCRTVSSSYEVYTAVSAIYVYRDSYNGCEYELNDSAQDRYGSEVIFQLPSGNYECDYVSADHLAHCENETWTADTYEKSN